MAWRDVEEFDFSRLDASANEAASTAKETLAMFQIGLDRHKSGDLKSAAAVYQEVLRRDPENAEAQHLLGLVAYQAGQPEPAIGFISRAIEINPKSAPMYGNRGLALAAAGKFEAAIKDYEQAIALNPVLAAPYQNRGAALQALERHDEAIASYDHALELDPGNAAALNDRGGVLRALGRREAALADYEAAIALDRGSVAAWYNRGGILRDLGRVDEAVESYGEAIALNPEFAIAHHNRALCRLQLGDYLGGFEEYEWRKRCPTFDDPRYGLDRAWEGQPLQGKSLFVYPELYQGDVIQFARFVLAAEQAGARVRLAAPVAMHALLQTLSPSIELLGGDQTPETYDFQAALMSLPRGFRTTVETLPNAPYLRADPARVARWREAIGPRGFKVGVVWQGSTLPYALPLQRSFPLAALKDLAALPEVRLISLQKVNGLEQLKDLPAGMTVEDLGEGFDPGPDLFVDTAAAMTCCDLVITPDTSVAHLAGALGVSAWLAVPAISDWRWMSGRQDSPWYPHTRIFRQSVPGDWTAVFGEMATELQELR
ncbi:MAG: tetratricopeptide repeat protein [Phenylobacterium sp.]